MRTIKSIRWLLAWLAWVFVGLGAPGPIAWAQQGTAPGVAASPIRLDDAAALLERRYSKPVTYEGPNYVWRGDTVLRYRDFNKREVWGAKILTFAMPDGLTPDKAPTLDAALVTEMLDAYHQQNPGGVRFRVLQSKLGPHIIPAQVHDATGVLVPGGSVLDTKISVPMESRTASEHMSALCHAVTLAAGVPLGCNAAAGASDDVIEYLGHRSGKAIPVESGPFWATDFDQEFAANGYTLRGPLRTPMAPTGDEDERPYMVFEWGAKRDDRP